MKILFVGGASQARLCYNILRQQGHEVPVIYDPTKGLAAEWDCALFDDESAIPERARGCDGFLVCIGDSHGEARTQYSRQLRNLGLQPVSAVHPTAFLGEQVAVGEGLQAMARSVVSDHAVIGDYCILNTNSTVDHECILGDGVHVMGSAALAGRVTVGAFSTIGTNATVLPRITIGTRCYVGAGAVVTKDVSDNAVVVGVPARVIRYATSAPFPNGFAS
jgi:sugar O-acyltransferase (sialic acid O-acetyltransferase NeuD family)